MDPFEPIKGMTPHRKQQIVIDRVTALVDLLLLPSMGWGRASGKTTLRLMLAKAIIKGDT